VFQCRELHCNYLRCKYEFRSISVQELLEMGHVTFSCKVQESKCIKCNGPHKTEHYCQFTWCCKANFKTNPPRLETKQSKPCSYSFKYLNCKGEHQANLNICPFWKHRFNRKWHSKKYQELQNIRNQSICSTVSSSQAWLSTTSKSFHKTFIRINCLLTLF